MTDQPAERCEAQGPQILVNDRPLCPTECALPAGHAAHHSDGHGARWAPTPSTPGVRR